MLRSFRRVVLAPGVLSLVLAASACSRHAAPSRSAGSPPFESNVPAASGAGARHVRGMAHAEDIAKPRSGMGHLRAAPSVVDPGGAADSTRPGGAQSLPGAPPSPAFGAAPGASPDAATGAAEALSERQICAELFQGAYVAVENIENGVQLVLTPKQGHDLAAVREVVRRIEGRLTPTGQQAATPLDASSQCSLFQVAREGTRATVQEAPRSIHLLLTAGDAAKVEALRNRMRELARTAGAQ